MNTLINKLNIAGWPGFIVGLACLSAMVLVSIYGNVGEALSVFSVVIIVHALMVSALRAEVRSLRNK